MWTISSVYQFDYRLI